MIKEKFVHQFERSLAAYLGIKNVIGTSMGRTALYAVLKAIDIKENDEVIIPAYICEVVPNAIIKLGGTPVFVDINENNYHISLSHLESLINEKTRAIIINHPFGVPEKIDEIVEIINKQPGKIFLIEDAAQALGAEYKGKKIGSFGDAAIFSLWKNMINIGGGAVVTNNQAIEEFVRKTLATVRNALGKPTATHVETVRGHVRRASVLMYRAYQLYGVAKTDLAALARVSAAQAVDEIAQEHDKARQEQLKKLEDLLKNLSVNDFNL